MKTVSLAGVLLAVAAASTYALDLGDGLVHLRAETWNGLAGPSGQAPAGWPASSFRAPAAASTILPWVVVTEGPSDRTIRESIERDGRTIEGALPSNAWIVRGTVAAMDALAGVSGVVRVESYRDYWKVDPDLSAEAPEQVLQVEIYRDADAGTAAAAIESLGAHVLALQDRWGVHRVVARAAGGLVPALAALPEVAWIEARGTLVQRNDEARWVIQSNVPDETPLFDHGLFGAGQIGGHVDGSLDTTSCYFRDPDHPIGPTHRKLVAWRYDSGTTADTHGTHTAGTLAGENVDPLAPENRGQAPKARISHTDWRVLDGDEWNGQPSNVVELFTLAHDDGARVHTNSWGDDTRTSYTTWCRDIDAFSRDHEDDLVVFASTNLSTLRSPENAKNCLAVGATQHSPNQEFKAFGGAGPTIDGRRKPEVFAPGQSTRSTGVGACATALSSGTSMASPAIAGMGLLIREYFVRGFYPNGRPVAANAYVPTGALVKAILVNSTVDMTGIANYPSDGEGWGRILVDDALYFPGDTRRLWLRDVRHANGLETGNVRSWEVHVEGSGEPLAVTLAFMDVPAAVGASVASVNDLDLEVEGPDGLFRGNVFDAVAGQSITGGGRDPKNNIERVVLPSPSPGTWTVRVRGTSVPEGPQGFAVVVNGDLRARTFVSAEAPDDGPRGGEVTVAESRLDAFRPNPFSQNADLVFAVPNRVPVSLVVYDVSGRRVRALVDRTVGAGEYRVAWDGRDESGRAVAPGMYFARLTGPGFEHTVRGVRLR
ncbi:MAG: S8 family serine peptidase [Gemmatimonadetes bacterium]|nr:S8 family serine peptidase [Gemmatimonadota bacterium]